MKKEIFVRPFVDQFGCIDKIVGRDGGDCCHRDFMYSFLIGAMRFMGLAGVADWPMNGISDLYFWNNQHHPSHGILIRHPDPDRDASDWDRGSRDQHIPFVVALSIWGWRETLWSHFKGHAKRFFWFHNTRENGTNKRNHGQKKPHSQEKFDYSPRTPDISDPEFFGFYIRGFRLWFLWPVLFFIDLWTLGGSIIKWWKGPKDNIVFNHEIAVIHSRLVMPTGIGWLCHQIFTPKMALERMTDHLDDFGDRTNVDLFFVDMFEEVYAGLK